MSTIIPYLLGGKTLQGVQPPHCNASMPHGHEDLVDIESCIDDPTRAPLGHHVKTRGHAKRNDPVGQVQIQKKHARKEVRSDGLLMLRRRGMEADELASQLANLLPPLSLFLKPQSQFQGLVELDISRNRLTQLPDNIAMLQHLRILNVSSNLLTAIPSVLYRLTQLQVLILSQNQLQIIPPEMPVHLPNLVTLRVAANRIQHLCPQIGQWHKMRHLQLGSVFGGNQLTSLPDEVADMTALEELDLSHNQLRVLPTNMGIRTLLHLNVSDNQLCALPKSIALCRRLRTLNVSKNHLATLPADLVELQRLELFDVSENLLCIIPADILERMRTTLLITGNPLTRPGHCDLDSSDAYTQILQRMTLRAVPMTRSPLFRDQCGPYGMGCEGPSAASPVTSVPTPTSSAVHTVTSATAPVTCTTPSTATTTAATTTATTAIADTTTPTASAATSSYSTAIIAPSAIHAYPSSPDMPFSSPYDTPPALTPLPERSAFAIYDGQDDDASIDRELSYHARQLNIRGSRPCTPHGIAGTISPSSSTLDFEPGDSPSPFNPTTPLSQQDACASGSTHLVHSLREIASRALLRNKTTIPPDYLPQHLAKDLSHKYRLCVACHGAFVNEWVTSVQVKSYKGHPAVVRRVRFCSNTCWKQCLGKSEPAIEPLVASTSTSTRSRAETAIDWIEAAVAASSEAQVP